MALPNQIQSTVPAGSDLPSTIDNRIRNLALGVEDILGIPDATNVSNAAINISSTGLSSINFQTAVTPSVSGVMARTGANLQYHDGTSSYSVTMNEKTQTLLNKTLTSPIENNGTYNSPTLSNAIWSGTFNGNLDFDGLHTLGLNYPYSLNVSVASSNLTVEVRNVDGNAISTTSTVPFVFRNATLATGTPVVRVADATTSIIAPSGASFGFTANQTSRLWVGMVDSGTSALPFLFHSYDSTTSNFSIKVPTGTRISTTAIDANSDSAGVAYSSAAQTNRPWEWIGYIEIQSGNPVGQWGSAPSVVQVYYPWMKTPGEIVQSTHFATGQFATTTNTSGASAAAFANSGGAQFMASDITPSSGVNLLECEAQIGMLFHSAGSAQYLLMGLFRDGDTVAVAAGIEESGTGTPVGPMHLLYREIADTAASVTTFKVRAGSVTAGTVTFTGDAAAKSLGGFGNSYIKIDEIMI